MQRLLVFLCVLGLLAAPRVWAASEIVEFGTGIVFTDAGGDAVLNLISLGNAAGRISARYDLGSTHTPHYLLKCTFQGVSALTAGNLFEVYLSYSTGSNPDGEVGTSDAALTTEKRRNLKLALIIEVDQAATDTNMTGSQLVEIPAQYVSVGVWNASGVTTEAGTGLNKCILFPVTRKIE